MQTMLTDAKLVAFVSTADARRARAFYEGVLGLRVVSEEGFAIVFDVGGTTLRVTIAHEVVVGPYTVLGWQVADIAATVRSLRERGVAFERYEPFTQDELGIWAAPGGGKVAWFKDPDGNILSLSQH